MRVATLRVRSTASTLLLWLVVLAAAVQSGHSAPPADAGTTPARERREPSPFPILDRDPALRKKITLDRPPESVGQLLRAIAKQTGAQIVCQGDFLKKTVVVNVKDQEAREVMTQVAMVARGVWIKRNGVYRMMENGMDLNVFQVGGTPVRASEAAKGLLRSLTAHQREWLRSQPLKWERLTPAQQQYMNIAFWQAYVQHPESYTRDMAADMSRLEVRIVPSDNGPTMMHLMAPTLTDDGKLGFAPFHVSEVR